MSNKKREAKKPKKKVVKQTSLPAPLFTSAEVEVVKVQEIGGGYITVLVTGDVGSVQSAVTAGGEAAERVGEVITRHVIARPSEQILSLYLTQ